MDREEKIKIYSAEIEQARKEHEELEKLFNGKNYFGTVENTNLSIFNIDGELFDGYYKSLTFTVYNENEICKVSEFVDIYKDEEEIMLFDSFDIKQK